jgi:hypothetical protein
MNPATADKGARLYFLDWVRIFAFFVLIVFHVGMYYVTWDWHVKSPFASDTPESYMMLSAPWRLGLLFMISGVASSFMLAKISATAFMRQRRCAPLRPLFGLGPADASGVKAPAQLAPAWQEKGRSRTSGAAPCRQASASARALAGASITFPCAWRLRWCPCRPEQPGLQRSAACCWPRCPFGCRSGSLAACWRRRRCRALRRLPSGTGR